MKRVRRATAIWAIPGLLLVPAVLSAQVPAVNGPVCVPVPGIPCPGSSSHSSVPSGGNLNAVVAGALFQWLFSPDPKAEAKKQQMMQELLARQEEAARQHRIEEAARLALICNRLSATLKLNGLPDLAMKDVSPSGGLHLKIGDSSDGHVGQKGLPGIALNDSTGNCGSTPYGIQGLPGIYTNGPGSGSGSAATGALHLKTGDDSTSTQPATNPAPAPSQPAPSDGASPSQSLLDAIRDPQNMTPQQLADAATLASSLPPEEQQRLMNAAAASSRSPAGDTPGQPAPSGSPSQPVAQQLQQVADASKAAASAVSLDDAAAKARSAFDQTTVADTSKAAVPVAGSSPSVPGPPPAQPPSASGPAAATSGRSWATPSPAVSTASISIEKPEPAVAVVADQPSMSGASCPRVVQKLIPSRPQLLTELAVRRAQLENLKNTITRLNRTIQLDQQQFAVWEDEAAAGVERVKSRIWDQATQFAFDNFVEAREEHFKDLEGKGLLTAFDRDQMRKLARARELKSFDDYRKWVMENKNDWETIEDGVRQLIDALPIEGAPKAYIDGAKDLIDNAYDVTDLIVTTDRVNQLDHNSTQFLEATRRNGERMKVIVGRIQEIQTQLDSTGEQSLNTSCRGVGPLTMK